MSGMSRILHILLSRDGPSRHEPSGKGDGRSGGYWLERIEPRRSQRPRRTARALGLLCALRDLRG